MISINVPSVHHLCFFSHSLCCLPPQLFIACRGTFSQLALICFCFLPPTFSFHYPLTQLRVHVQDYSQALPWTDHLLPHFSITHKSYTLSKLILLHSDVINLQPVLSKESFHILSSPNLPTSFCLYPPFCLSIDEVDEQCWLLPKAHPYICALLISPLCHRFFHPLPNHPHQIQIHCNFFQQKKVPGHPLATVLFFFVSLTAKILKRIVYGFYLLLVPQSAFRIVHTTQLKLLFLRLSVT